MNHIERLRKLAEFDDSDLDKSEAVDVYDGARWQLARLMPIIQAQEERIKALRAAAIKVALIARKTANGESQYEANDSEYFVKVLREALIADDFARESILRGDV